MSEKLDLDALEQEAWRVLGEPDLGPSEYEDQHHIIALVNRIRELERASQPGSGEKVDERDSFEKTFPMPRDCIRCGTGYAATGYNAWTAHEYCQKWRGWQARASLDGRMEEDRG